MKKINKTNIITKMKTVAEQVLCKHNVEKRDIATLAVELAVETVDSSTSTTYIYDDDSYTTIFVGGERHTTGVNNEVDEYTIINEEYLTTRQLPFYEHKIVVNDKEIQPQGRSPTNDPIIRNAITQRKALLAYCVKTYNEQKQTLANQESQSSIELETSEDERKAWNELKYELLM